MTLYMHFIYIILYYIITILYYTILYYYIYIGDGYIWNQIYGKYGKFITFKNQVI